MKCSIDSIEQYSLYGLVWLESWLGLVNEQCLKGTNTFACSVWTQQRNRAWPTRLDRWRRFRMSRACRSRRGPPHPGPTSRGSAPSPRCRTRSCSAPPRSSGCTCDPLVRMGELQDWHEPYEPGSDDKMIKDLLCNYMIDLPIPIQIVMMTHHNHHHDQNYRIIS